MKTFEEYQRAAMRTASDGSLGDQLAEGVMGLCGEAGEACNHLKKVLYHDHPLDCDKVAEELGDQLWYISLLSEAIGISLREIAGRNIAKLKRRYANGFEAERSLKREP